MQERNQKETAFTAGTVLGRQQAFGLVAGRCTVAVMECLIETYERKLYLEVEPTWEDYCKNRLGVSRRTAERMMLTYRRQGPKLAKLNCFTRILPREYQMFDAVLTDEGLVHNGEVIALEPANAPRLAQAADEIRQEAKADAEPVDPVARLFAKAERSLNSAIAELAKLHATNLDQELRRKLADFVESARDQLVGFSSTAQ